MIDLRQGDCLEIMKSIEKGSVDAIICDLPYGTVKGIENVNHGMSGKCEWDDVIDTDEIMKMSEGVLRRNGKMLLFSQQPFTTTLINGAVSNLPFGYSLIWVKDHFANSLVAKKAPVNYYEEILVFSKSHDSDNIHPLRDYAKDVARFVNKSRKQRKEDLGNRGSDHFLEVIKNPLQFSLCTEKTYNALIDVYRIDKMEGFKSYFELTEIDLKYTAVFNLPENSKIKSNVFEYKKDYDGHHPTQKPVALLEDLIKTYTNESETVLDMTMGSGSTGVACVNTNRKFIGIELDENYFNVAKERIENHI